jgi:hypothetical protein
MVALLSPEDVLDRSVLAGLLAKGISAVLPVYQYASKSHFGQMAILYNAVVWCSFPFLVRLFWLYLQTRPTGLLTRDKEMLRWFEYLILVFLAIPISVLMVYAFVFMWNGLDTRLVPFASSRLALGVFGICIPGGGAFFLTVAAGCIKRIFVGKI